MHHILQETPAAENAGVARANPYWGQAVGPGGVTAGHHYTHETTERRRILHMKIWRPL